MPEFYLSRFADESGRVLRTFKPPSGALHERRFAPRATGYEEDLYSIEPESSILSGGRPDAIETEFFGPIDNSAATVLEKLIQQAPSALSESEREYWAIFVNSLIERHPQRLRRHFKSAQVAALARRQHFLTAKSAQDRAFYERILTDLDEHALARNCVRRAMATATLERTVIDYFRNMSWVKFHLEAPNGMEFMTADNPVLINFGQVWPIEIMTLALSPLNLMIMFKPGAVELTKEFVLNAVVLHNLELFRQSEYLYSRSPVQDLEGIMLRRAAEQELAQRPWDRR